MAEKITGYTSEMCQQAMIDELKELFRDMKFTGQEGEKPLKIFKQFIPSPTDDDDDVDTNRSNFPCIIVSRTSGEVVNEKDPQLVLLQLIICCYDPKTDRQGYVYAPNFTIYGSMNAEDLRSIMDEGYEKFCEYVERYEREKRRTQYGT